jgi:hypothetical protein
MADFPTSPSLVITHLLEALSLEQCLETQDPPNPITSAALKHSIADLIAELHASNFEFQSEQTD